LSGRVGELHSPICGRCRDRQLEHLDGRFTCQAVGCECAGFVQRPGRHGPRYIEKKAVSLGGLVFAILVAIALGTIGLDGTISTTNEKTHAYNLSFIYPSNYIAVPASVAAFIGAGTTGRDSGPERKRELSPTENNGGFTVAFFERATDDVPRTEKLSWDRLESVLTTYEYRGQKDGPLFSPTEYRPGTTRASKNIERLTFWVGDVDDGTPLEALRDHLAAKGLTFVIGETFSSTPEHRKFRVSVPFAKPVPASEWGTVWSALAHELGLDHVDRATKDPSRIFYLPSAPPGSKPVTYRNTGKPFDVSALKHEAARPASRSPALAPANTTSDCAELLRRIRLASADGPLLAHVLDTTRGEPRSHELNLLLCWELYRSGANEDVTAGLLEWSISQAVATYAHFREFGAYSYKLAPLIEKDPILKSALEVLKPKAQEKGTGPNADAVLERMKDFREGTELGISARFAERFSGRLRFDVNSQKWRVLKDYVWPETEKDVTKEMARAILDGIKRDADVCSARCGEEKAKDLGHGLDEFGKPTKEGECCAYRKASDALYGWAKRSAKDGTLAQAIKGASTWPGVQVANDELDPSPWELPCATCVINLRTGDRRPYRSNDLWTWKSPFDPDSARPAPKWTAFLKMISKGAADFQDYLQRLAFYWITGDNGEQEWWDVWGEGGNGKTTLLRTIAGTIPGATADADRKTFASTKSDRIPNDLAALRKKRLILVPEPTTGDPLDESLVNGWTGGDKVKARFLNHEWFEFLPPGKLVMFGSEKPRIVGQSRATWRRPKFVKITAEVPKGKDHVDKYWEVMLKEEGPAILTWILDGRKAYFEKGVTPPDQVLADTADFRKESDFMAEFLEDCLQKTDGGTAPVGTVHAAFIRWAIENNEKALSSWSAKKLGRQLEERGYTRSASHKEARSWEGVTLTDKGLHLAGQTVPAPTPPDQPKAPATHGSGAPPGKPGVGSEAAGDTCGANVSPGAAGAAPHREKNNCTALNQVKGTHGDKSRVTLSREPTIKGSHVQESEVRENRPHTSPASPDGVPEEDLGLGQTRAGWAREARVAAAVAVTCGILADRSRGVTDQALIDSLAARGFTDSEAEAAVGRLCRDGSVVQRGDLLLLKQGAGP
jgi:putative DNA primase/helicase